MQLIAPDILVEARQLSPAILGTALGFGWLVWLLGLRRRRFWIVVAITVAGGLFGLHSGKISGGHVLATGVLLALAAGLLALELARIFAFVAAGMGVWLAAGMIFPAGQELWIAFLIGGLGGVLLYDFWTMVLTSFLGTLISSHALLCLLDHYLKFDCVAWTTPRGALLNGGVILGTILGILWQSWLERYHRRRLHEKKYEKEAEIREDERKKVEASQEDAPTIWERIFGRRQKSP